MNSARNVAAWVDSYLRAWHSNSPADIAALFTVDARYFTAPYQEPWLGREAIAAGWVARADEPGSFSFEWELISSTPDAQVVRGTTRYPHTTYSNLWVIRLTDQQTCREFTEYWMEHPADYPR